MTLRTRLLVSLLAIFATLAVAGFIVAQSQRRFLVEQVDDRLEAAIPPAQNIARDALDANPNTGPDPRFAAPTALSELYVGVVNSAGELTTLFAPGLGSSEPTIDRARLARMTPDRPFQALQPITVETGDGSASFRVAMITTQSGQRLIIGLSLERVQSAYNRLLLGALGAASAVVAVTGVAAWWVYRLGLRPIRDMTEAADAIARGELARRVDHPSPRTEAGRLGRAFNVMLDERQGSEERLRRFVSDASHELRTPLTSIRGYVELYRKGGLRQEGELSDAMRRIAGEGARMGALVDDLLLLARLDEGRPLADEPLDLAELLRDATGDLAALHPNRAMTSDIAATLPLRGDEARLRQVIGAVLTNALVHTPEHAAIRVVGRNQGDVDIIEVRDEGDGMAPEVAAKVFERFYRGDPSRTRHRGGSGLGLSIVRSIVEAHAGRVAIESTPGAGTVVRIVLPVRDGADSQETRG